MPPRPRLPAPPPRAGPLDLPCAAGAVALIASQPSTNAPPNVWPVRHA